MVLGGLLLAGCGRVVIDDEGEVESSSAGGPGSGGTLTGSGGGDGTGSDAGPSSVGSGGAGGASAATGNGSSGAGTGGGAVACDAFGWEHTPDLVDQVVDQDWERWVVADGARLTGRGGEVLALHAGRATLFGDPAVAGPRGGAWWTVDGAWTGRPTLQVAGRDTFFFEEATPWVVAAEGIGAELWLLGTEVPSMGLLGEGVGPAAFAAIGSGGQATTRALTSELAWLRDVEVAADGTLAAIAGVERLEAWATASDGIETKLVGAELYACGDRELAVDLATIGGHLWVAHADGTYTCGAPTVLSLERVDQGDSVHVTHHDELDLGAPIVSVQLIAAAEPWAVVRTEGTDFATLVRFTAVGEIAHQVEVPLAADRQVTATAWSTGLVLVDTGAATADTPWIRVRALDREGAVSLASTVPPSSHRPEGTPAALVAPGGDAVLITFVERTAEDVVRHGVVRADCVAD